LPGPKAVTGTTHLPFLEVQWSAAKDEPGGSGAGSDPAHPLGAERARRVQERLRPAPLGVTRRAPALAPRDPTRASRPARTLLADCPINDQ
jgi:hypothetical protein